MDPKKAAASDLPVGFEQLWTVWPRKHHIAKARATYKALAPDPALHATLVAKATQWAAHYQQTATEKRWWKHMHTWLAEERYLEDPPEPYENPKEAAIARKRESGPRKASKQETVGKSGLSSGTPIGRHKVSITDFDMTGGSFDKEREFIVSFKIEDGDHGGKVFSHTFNFISSDEDTQTAGQMHYTNIRHATGILEPDDTSDFHGKTLVANVKAMGRIEYASL
ncbi:hypothetical protein [Bradyrhizobium sp. 23]|uniref:hypothetical protein n=1 Tax=Bradyrhizobium sp. 23 TaxID=2782667 RepID=UPI001FF8A4E4|nr:hypothetical protein [Bradyrhizobium sp. 23]MCK1313703.1 hypothetical protein [Bradyrhizobium sp. 23]